MAMSDDRTVQVPVSLIERALTSMTTERYDNAAARELEALLPQPTPTAEHADDCSIDVVTWVPGWEGVPTALPGHCDCGRGADAKPPRIEDMAPGTTFTARLHLMDGLTDRCVFMRVDGVDVVDDAGARWHPQDIDPSTIRDVTPPKEAC